MVFYGACTFSCFKPNISPSNSKHLTKNLFRSFIPQLEYTIPLIFKPLAFFLGIWGLFEDY